MRIAGMDEEGRALGALALDDGRELGEAAAAVVLLHAVDVVGLHEAEGDRLGQGRARDRCARASGEEGGFQRFCGSVTSSFGPRASASERRHWLTGYWQGRRRCHVTKRTRSAGAILPCRASSDGTGASDAPFKSLERQMRRENR